MPNTNKENYEEFIIGISDKGNEISFSCNPEKLANNFGVNPENPYYLTPVFFERKVLERYYSEPSKYSIKDGYLSCGDLWGMEIDNNHEKYVIVYLGDLGRDLPERDRKYWRSFNVVPDGDISNVHFSRGFLAEFADPSSPDLVFKQKLDELKKAWGEKYGWDLFKDLNKKDEFHLVALRIPMRDEQPEFDSQIQSLAEILIESINESEIKKEVSIDKDDKSIAKLEKYFYEKKFTNYQKHITLLKCLQALRSKGSAHRKSKDYEKKYFDILSTLNISSNKLSHVFRDILYLVINFLDYLISSCKK
jgi:hypothetical protein